MRHHRRRSRRAREHRFSNAGDNRETLIQNALASFVQSHNIKKEAVAVGVSGQSSFARFIKLPPVEPKQIPSIVRFEAIQQIPFPLDEVEWSYQLFKDETSPDVEVGIFAMRKELVQEHLKFFTETGLNVQVVQMNPLAVYNAMYYDQRLKGTTMIIDMGAENTDLIIAEGETIWLRSISYRRQQLYRVAGQELQAAVRESRGHEAATPPPASTGGLRSSRRCGLSLPIWLPRFSVRSGSMPRCIAIRGSPRSWPLGSTFRLPGLQKYLQQNLQLEVQKIDHLGQRSPRVTPRWRRP